MTQATVATRAALTSPSQRGRWAVGGGRWAVVGVKNAPSGGLHRATAFGAGAGVAAAAAGDMTWLTTVAETIRPVIRATLPTRLPSAKGEGWSGIPAVVLLPESASGLREALSQRAANHVVSKPATAARIAEVIRSPSRGDA